MKLDDAYANGRYIDGAEDYPPRWSALAQDFRDNLGERARLDIRYGDRDRERFDLFLPDSPIRGLCVFIHGGYWMAFDKSSWSHLARGPLERGWAVAMPSYDLCSDVTIPEITAQMTKAMPEMAAQVDGPIVLAGHSAGGHLVSRLLDKSLLSEDLGSRIERVVPISPLSNLRPLLQTTMNETLQLTEETAASESPVDMMDRYPANVTVWVGSAERPAFLDQASWLSQAWGADCVRDAGKHHFNVIDALMDPSSELVDALVG